MTKATRNMDKSGVHSFSRTKETKKKIVLQTCCFCFCLCGGTGTSRDDGRLNGRKPVFVRSLLLKTKANQMSLLLKTKADAPRSGTPCPHSKTGRCHPLVPFPRPRVSAFSRPKTSKHTPGGASKQPKSSIMSSSSTAVPPSPIHFTGDVTVENIFFPDNAKLPMGSQCLVQETAKGVSGCPQAESRPPPVSFRLPLPICRST